MGLSVFIKLLKEVVNELTTTTKDKYNLETFCDMLTVITKNDDKKIKIFGYNFDLDGAATNMMCKDKIICSEYLMHNNVMCMYYKFFYKDGKCVLKNIISDIIKYCNEIRYPVVLKQNDGTCGNFIYYAKEDNDVKKYAIILLKKFKSLIVTKYEKIKNEYRFVIVDGKIELVYKKIKPYIVGDGKNNVKNLMLKKYNKNIINSDDLILESHFNSIKDLMKYVPKKNEKIEISWKHNLSKFSSPIVVTDIDNDMKDLSIKAINVLQIKNCSIDIIENDKGEKKIIEVNGGIMMDNFSKFGTYEYLKTKDIYKKIILQL